MFNAIISYVVDFLFPSRCINCSTVISYKDPYLCKECYGKIEFLSAKCSICSGDLVEGICNICSSRKFYIDKNITITEYSGIMKEILHNYKFNKRRRLYKLLSLLSIEEVSKWQYLFNIITSVPINKKKKWDRGFNQSELIARDIAKKLKKVYFPILKERYHFKSQKELGYRNRFLNILDRYKIKNAKRKRITGMSVLIVDDVFTTGATINECARILKTFGAEKVYSLTIARTNIKRVDKFSF